MERYGFNEGNKTMSNNGLAVTPEGTTAAPKLYEEMEQMGDVARGHVEVKEIIAYDFVRREYVKDEFGNKTDKQRVVENGRPPYFCQTKEQEVIFKENNPDARIETFSVQLLKSTAIKYLDDPRNVKQFTKEEPVQTFQEPESNWREQAKALGIVMFQRSKEDVLADIASQTTTSVS